MTAPQFHRVDITDLLGGGWLMVCTCGKDGMVHQLANDALSAAEARRDAALHSRDHEYRVICPDCRRNVRARPVPQQDALRLAEHTRPMSQPYKPGQTCEQSPVIPAGQVVLAPV
jgi:hypothetical protein